MKTLKNIFLLMIVVATIFTSCKPAGDEPTPNSTPNNTNVNAPVFTIPNGGFQFKVLGDTTIDLTQYVSEPQNDGWSLVAGSLTADNGTVSFNSTTNELTYTAPTNTSLTSDVIHFTLTDTNGNTQSYNVTINLNNTTNISNYSVFYVKFTYDDTIYVFDGTTDGNYGYSYGAFGVSNGSGVNKFGDFTINTYLYEKAPDDFYTTNKRIGASNNVVINSLVGKRLNIVRPYDFNDPFSYRDTGGNDVNNNTYGLNLTINGNTYYSVNSATGEHYIEYTEKIQVVYPESGGQIGDAIKGNFNILLNNGKTITGSFQFAY